MLSEMARRTISKDEVRQVLQEKIARYMNLQQSIRAYQLVYEVQRNQLEELIVTMEALENIKKRGLERFDGFASLGSGVYIYVDGRLGGKILVNVGANIGVFMSIDKALEVLKGREEKIRTNMENTAKTLRELTMLLVRLEQEISTLQQYLASLDKKS